MKSLVPRTRPEFAALMLLVVLWAVLPSAHAGASAPLGLPADSSCASLAAVDHSATNGSEWGRTLLAGHNAPGGWFGVDVCGNGINAAHPGGANVSCDRLPSNPASFGCAPGHATYDGFGLSFQCVELVVRFAAWAFGDAPSAWRGDAPDLWQSGNHPADFVAVPNASQEGPARGDVLVWGRVDSSGAPWPAGPSGDHDGHVAVVAAVHDDSLSYVEQNALIGQSNIPMETLPLTHGANGWTAGDPGGSRRLYGWLHSTKNTGLFDGAYATRGAATSGGATPTTSATPAPAADAAASSTIILPSLAHGVVVTAAGALTDLTWVDGSLAGPEIGPLQVQTPRPHIAARNLAAPPASPLAANQAPAVVSAADGTRDVYVLGQDGAVYAAHSAPTVAGITWRALGAPPAVSLAGGVAAVLLPNALMVGAISTDGNLWWRVGPAGNLSGWTSMGHPAGTLLIGPPVLLGEPGTGLPLAVAMGRDGKLYENSWSSSTSASASPDSGWGQWTALSLPTGASGFAPPLFAVSELATPHSRIGQWADVSVDLLARTATGQVWLLRRDASAIWTFRTLGTERPVERLFGAIVVPSAATGAGASQLQIYVADDKDILLGTLAVGQSSGSASLASWTTLGPLWQDPSTPTPGSVIALGPHLSVLALASGDKVALVGTEEARSLVADQTAATLAQPVPGAANAIFAPAVP